MLTIRKFLLALLSALPTAAAAVSSTVDATGDSGLYSSMQLNAGKPVVAYTRDSTVMLATCTANCATATPTWVIATVGAGNFPSLQLNAGFPVVSYVDGGAVKLATCTAGCDTVTPTWVATTVLATGGYYHALGLASGNPVVVYADGVAQEVNVATCTADCATATPTWARSNLLKKQVGDMYFVGAVSIAMNGNVPWVGYEKSFIGGSNLTVVTCTADCGSAGATWAGGVVDVPLQGHSLQLRNGLPAVAYYSFPQFNQDLKYGACTAGCDGSSATWTTSIVESTGNTGRGPSLQFASGLPVVSFIDGASKLKVARCTANCIDAAPTWTFDIVDDGDSQTSLAMAGSVPFMTYHDKVNLDLRYAVILPPAPALQLSATSLDFGTLSVNTTSNPQVVTITNNGGATLNISQVIGTGPVRAANACPTIAPLQSCSLPVSLYANPNSTEALNATYSAGGIVHITSDAPGSPHTITVTGSVEKSLVLHYYRSILRREPDTEGRKFFRDQAMRVVGLGASVNEVWFAMAQTFFFSAEYVAFNRDNVGFVTDLYRTFFAREPDSGGLGFWVDLRANGLPREVMIAAFMFSPEFVSFTQVGFGNTAARAEVDLVMDFYRGLLARLPDDSGFDYWVGRFRAAQCPQAIPSPGAAVVTQAELISRAFALSDEYAARNRSNAQYVGDLYNSFLRRGGDLDGVQFWVDQIANGARTRENVRYEFTLSAEFDRRVQAVIAQGCSQ